VADNLKKVAKFFVLPVLILLLVLEVGVRIIIDLPADTDFYGSIGKQEIKQFQELHQIKFVSGSDWIHLGWIADPDNESYLVYRKQGDAWLHLEEVEFGSFLQKNLEAQTSYTFRVKSNPSGFDYIATVDTKSSDNNAVYVPEIVSDWRPLFRPAVTGSYLNDHTVFQSEDGKWHIIGITSFGDGDYSKEFYLAHGASDTFPPQEETGMKELEKVADFGHLAWAPHVVGHDDTHYMWFSPHKAYLATSNDGYNWNEEKAHTFLPYHPQFRDPMILKVADGQWLMYVTAREGYYSSVDLYQSFDLLHWQYIRSALGMGFGAERSGPQASTESPFVTEYERRYYLSLTYNNESFFFHSILLALKIWPDKKSYNDTLVFQSESPYDFGTYRGRGNAPSLVAELEAHAPEIIYNNGWYITTCGWPWVATLTSGETAYARLEWKRR